LADEKEKSTTNEIIDSVTGIVTAIPVYQDAIQPAAKEIGKALQTVTKSIHVLLAPVEIVVWGYERIKEKLSEELSPKIQQIPEERLISPSPNIAVPIVESLRYLGYDDNLRKLYVNLLASAMDLETAYRAHPSFVEIIKQLTSDEAKILQLLSQDISIPLISVQLYTNFKGISKITKFLSKDAYSYNTGISSFSNIGELASCKYPDLSSTYLDNLARLGIIEIQRGVSFTDSKKYVELENHITILNFISQNNLPNQRAEIKQYSAELTNFGKQFIAACITDDEYNTSI